MSPAASHPGSQSLQWRACRNVQIRGWADGAIIYDTASGNTHQLTPTAAQILNLLLNAPRSQEQLTSSVLSSQASGADPSQLTFIEDILSHLMELGLIEPLPH